MPDDIAGTPIVPSDSGGPPPSVSAGGTRKPDAAPPPMGPLTPVFLTWPRKTFSQTWVFMWIGVLLLVASFMPFKGSGDVVLLQDDGSSMTRNEFVQERLVAEGRKVTPPARNFIGFQAPGMTLGALVVMICAFGLILNGFKNIWTRRLVFWPITLVVFVILVVLWFTSTTFPSKGFVEMDKVTAFGQVGEIFSVIGGLFANVTEAQGKLDHAEFVQVFDRFGSGLYLAFVAWAFLVLVIVGSLVVALITSGKKDSAQGAKKGRPAGRRPGGRK